MPSLIPPAFQQRISDWMTTNLFTDSASVQREVNSLWTPVVGMAAVPCLVTSEMYTGPMAEEQLGADLKIILFPRLTDVHSPDRLVIAGINYRVFDVGEPKTIEILRRVVAVRFPQRFGA